MKNKYKYSMLLGTMAVLTAQAQAVSVIVNFAPNGQNGNGINEANDAGNGSLFSNANLAGAFPVSIGAINGPGGGGASTLDLPQFDSFTLTDAVSGATGDFDIVLSVTSNNTTLGLPINRGGVGAAGVDNTLIDPGESLTVSFDSLISTGAPVVGGSFQFTGFNGVFIGNTSPDESVLINGVSFDGLGTTPGTIANASVLNLGGLNPTVIIEGDTGGVALSGIVANFEFVPIPEPSSTALLGLGGLALLARRKRA